MASSLPFQPIVSRRIEIVAEIANAHQGDPATAEMLADAALAAGADAVKFQVYFANELVVRRHPKFEHFGRIGFAPDVWSGILRRLIERGARVYCDVFGPRALEVASAAAVHGFKVHSSDLGNEPLLRAIAPLCKPVMLAVGGSTFREIARAVAVVTESSRVRPILLHGFQSYPTPVEDSSLARIDRLRQIFGRSCDIGYMDHVDADDPFATILPVLAMGMGASVLEKHITLDRAALGIDYYSSFNPDEFDAFVRTIRRAETAVGADTERFSESEHGYRRQMKKHWVIERAMRRGELIAAGDLTMKRADHDAAVPDLEQILGRPLLDDRPAEHIVSRGDVPQRVWALIVARMQSSRLPAKAVLDVAGMPAIRHLIERVKQAKTVDRIVLCTTREAVDDQLVAIAEPCGVSAFRGESEDVLARMLGAIEGHDVDVVLRITGDDLLVDPEYLDVAVRHHLQMNAEYTDMKRLPSGTEAEVFDAALLRLLAGMAQDTSGTEYLTSYVVHHRDQFRTTSGPVEPRHCLNWRLTLDTAEDLAVIRALLDAMRERGKPLTYRMDDIVSFFEEQPSVLALNATVAQRQAPVAVQTELVWSRLT